MPIGFVTTQMYACVRNVITVMKLLHRTTVICLCTDAWNAMLPIQLLVQVGFAYILLQAKEWQWLMFSSQLRK